MAIQQQPGVQVITVTTSQVGPGVWSTGMCDCCSDMGTCELTRLTFLNHVTNQDVGVISTGCFHQKHCFMPKSMKEPIKPNPKANSTDMNVYLTTGH